MAVDAGRLPDDEVVELLREYHPAVGTADAAAPDAGAMTISETLPPQRSPPPRRGPRGLSELAVFTGSFDASAAHRHRRSG